MWRSGIHVVAEWHIKMLKLKPCVLFTFRRFFYLNIGGFSYVYVWQGGLGMVYTGEGGSQFRRLERMQFYREGAYVHVWNRAVVRILYRAHEERLLASQSTYIAREPQWLSLRLKRDPPTQKKKNKRPFSRPANKTNKEKDTNILVFLLFFSVNSGLRRKGYQNTPTVYSHGK